MRVKSVLISVLCALSGLPARATAADLSGGRWIDLTHPFDAESICWPTAKMFDKESVFEGHTGKGCFYSAFNFASAEHVGTHLDVLIQFAEEALPAHQAPADQLIGPGVVIEVTAQAPKDVVYLVTVEDIEVHEKAHGKIPEGAIVTVKSLRAP